MSFFDFDIFYIFYASSLIPCALLPTQPKVPTHLFTVEMIWDMGYGTIEREL